MGNGGGLSICAGVDSVLVDGVGSCLGCSGVTGNVPGGPVCHAGFSSGVSARICSARDVKDVWVLSKMLVTSASFCESSASGEGYLGDAAFDGARDCVDAGGKVTKWPFV